MDNQYGFGIYEKALMPNSWEKMFKDAANCGYSYFELSLDETDKRLARLEWNFEKRREVISIARDNGIQIFSANLSGQRRFPMGSADKEIERKSMELLKKAIDFCVDMGIRVLQLSGFDVYYEPHTADTQKRYCENIAIGADMASKAGVMLAIEPVEGNIISVRQAMEVVEKVNSPWLKVYPDVANMAAMGLNPVEELSYGGGSCVALHIRDAVKDTSYNIPIGTGIVDFKGVFLQLKKNNFQGPIIVELWNEDNSDYLSIITKEREFFENVINSI